MAVHGREQRGGWEWAIDEEALVEIQQRLGAAARVVEPWEPPRAHALITTAFFICYQRGLLGSGRRGDPAWVAAVSFDGRRMLDEQVLRRQAGAAYIPGLLALREGTMLEQAFRSLAMTPDLLIVNATGSDHPRRAGLATHLGAVVGVPSIGITDRPLLATGEPPGQQRGEAAPLLVDGAVVGYRLRSRAGVKPICVNSGWRTSVDLARDVVFELCQESRTPEPLRQARRLARESRSSSGAPA